jgi:hypothetical protein
MADRFEQAVGRMAEINARDPNRLGGRPKELVAAERLVEWVRRLAPDASEPLRLAANCQHVARFEIPRSTYPADRTGYLKWRKRLAQMHAERSREILTEVGYDAVTVAAVVRINLKQGRRDNPDTQTMEDALSLSFLEHEFAEFCEKHSDDKIIGIVQKTWSKMSQRARELAQGLTLTGRAQNLVGRALASR